MVSRALALACSCLAASCALAASELIHPYPPTGPLEVAGPPAATKSLRAVQHYAMPAFTDLLATHVAHALQGASSEPVTVVRKSRRSGAEAEEVVARAAPDGRTLLLAIDAPSLRGVARVALMPYVLVVRNDARYADVDDLVARAQKESRRLLAASAGERTVSQRALDMMRSQFHIPIEPIAYHGGYAALQALVSNEVSAALVPMPSLTPYLASGRVKVLKTGKTVRLDVADAFHIFAPVDTPNIIVARINATLAETLVTPDAEAVFSKLGVQLDHRSAGTRQ